MNRRATRLALSGLFIALLAPGCRAYDARYWSFPLNSMQMVDDAVTTERTYGDALGRELLLQFFPWSWIVSLVDVVMLPITLPYDLVELAIRRDPPFPFVAQVDARQRQGVKRPPRSSPEKIQEAGPHVRPDRGVTHFEPAEH